jgi:pyruvate,water dikinase
MTGTVRLLAPGLDPADVGRKAAVLGELTALDVGVPAGWVLPVGVCRAFHDAGALPQAVVDDIQAVAGQFPDGLWAVRSSGTQEDSAAHSFAGQFATCLDVAGEDLADAVVRCYRSAAGERVAAYHDHAGLAPQPLMGVIVQRMVCATASAVVFTVDPVTGEDTVAVAEVAPGPGEDLVGGRVTARVFRHDWLDRRPLADAAVSAPPADGPAADGPVGPPADSPVGPLALANLWQAVWRVQEWAGAPCDVEAVFEGDSVSVVQSRPVTAVGHAGLEDVWSTADFRDGGVASGVFPPFMWSLYEYIWERAFPDFLVGLGTLPAKRRRRASRVFYGRPYWNAQMTKEAMARVPGYVEREFDEDLGVAPAYEGDGAVTRLTPRSALTVARVGLTELVWARRRLKTAARLKADLEALCEARLRQLADVAADDLPELFSAITKEDYFASESTYFSQIFLNQAHQSLVRSRLGKFCDQADYLALIGGLGGLRRGAISHLAPFHELWELSRRVLADPAEARWWLDTEPGRIAAALQDGCAAHPHLADLRAWLDRYGYHSERELDITHPSFAEDPAAAVRQLRANLELGEQASPALDADRAEAARGAALDRLRAKVSPRRYRALAAQVAQMRELLWWREAFRDVSTKQYHLIRQVSLRLADQWARAGVIERPDDFWFAHVAQVWAVVEGRETPAWLRARIRRNRRYFTAYRNYRGPEEIGAHVGVRPPVGRGLAGQRFQGVGCQASTGRGRARVVESLDQIGRLSQGDILVTRFTDTGWTPAFARLGGVVTEYGGMLCHAAIVSREFAIPCVVALAGATRAIPDGALVEVDGAAGTVTVLEGA